jgi:PAS domain S-box-containing protein
MWPVLLLLLAIVPLGASEGAPRRVLLLHSFGREFAPFNAFSGNFRTELARLSPEPVDFFELSLESARFNSIPEEEPIVEYFRTVYAGRRIDLVVPIGGAAVRFAQKHRQQLFPQVPVLFAGMDERHLAGATLTANDTMVAVRNDPVRNLESILQILPQTTNVAVVIGDSPLERFWLGELSQAFAPFTNRVNLMWLNDQPFADMLERCAALPPHSAILYIMLAMDAGGVPHLEDRAIARIHSVANAPLFGIHETQFGRGIVGGPLMRVDELSLNTAKVAARILAGEPPGDIKTAPQPLGQPIFDARELSRWNIPESRLPAGSVVKFHEPTMWERYRWRIVAVTSLCLIEAALIVVLFVNFIRLRRTERLLVEKQNRLRAILDTAAEGIITLNDRGNIESVNPAASRIFGYPAAELTGQNLKVLIPSGFPEAPGDGRLNDGQAHPSIITDGGREVAGRRKDGSVFPLELAVSEMLLDGQRKFTGCVRDVTERRQAEQATREFGGRLLHAQEAERARLARELHDDITQRLACLAIDAGRVEAKGEGNGRGETLRELRDGLVRLSEDVHTLSYQLHPSLLEDLGLPDALRAECERFTRQESIPVEMKLEPAPADTPFDVGLCLFRITQEALRNVARHARARSASISLRACDDGLQLAVTDNGMGFDVNGPPERPSLGLESMRERVRLLNGELEIESAPGQGTTILAWVPLKGTTA